MQPAASACWACGGAPAPPLTRTRSQRTAELRGLATRLGWSADLGITTLDDLVAELGRQARRGPVTPELPPAYRLFYGSLARPVSNLAMELGGLDTPVLAPLYLLPAAARTAVTTWRTSFLDGLEYRHANGRGEAGASEALLSHLARWGRVIGQPRPGTQPPDPAVQLTLLERPRLRWPRDSRDPRLWLCWRFRVNHVAAPRLRGLVAGDPGMRRLWTTLDAAGVTFFDDPMEMGTWKPPGQVTLRGALRRPWIPGQARVEQHAALVTHFLHPV